MITTILWIAYGILGLIAAGIAGRELRSSFNDIFNVILIQVLIFAFWPAVGLGYILWKSTDVADYFMK